LGKKFRGKELWRALSCISSELEDLKNSVCGWRRERKIEMMNLNSVTEDEIVFREIT